MGFQDNEQNIQELMSIFQVESEEILDRIFEGLINYEKNPEDKEVTATLYRDLHSLKGKGFLVCLVLVTETAHKPATRARHL